MVLGKLFVSRGCSFCNSILKSIPFFNAESGVGNRIGLVQVKGGSPEVQQMQDLYDDDWLTPTMILQKPVIKKKFNSYVKGYSKRAVVIGTMDAEYNLHFLKTYLEVE